MLKVKELKPNIWELTLSGVLEKHDIEEMERTLTPVLMGDGPIGLIVRAEDWKDITADALAEDAKFEFGMLPQWSRITKLAIVTDLQAFTAIMRWINPILPMIDMQVFGSSNVAEAEAFVTDLPAKVEPVSVGGITLLSDGKDGLIAYEVDGRITSENLEMVLEPMEALMTGDDKVDLLVRFKDWEGFDPAILMNGALMGTKMGAIKHLRRYAIIGVPGWMKVMVDGMSALMPFEIRLFDLADDDAAWTWVGAS